MPYDEKLAIRMHNALQDKPGFSEKKMFGGICYFLNGNMLCGVEVGRYMFRVGKDQQQKAEQQGAEVMEFNGRQMGGLVWVDAELCKGAKLKKWINLTEKFVAALPSK